MLEDPKLVEAMRAAVAHRRDVWRKLPHLSATDVGSGKWAIADTRRIAKEPLVVVSAEAVAALVHFERAHPRDVDHVDHETQIDALLARDFLIEYEGALMSVGTRRRSAARASTRSAAPAASQKLEVVAQAGIG